MVVTAGLLSSGEVQSTCPFPLPVTRVNDTVYSTTGRENAGRFKEMVTDVASGEGIVTTATLIPVELCTYNNYMQSHDIQYGNLLPHLSQSLQLALPVHWESAERCTTLEYYAHQVLRWSENKEFLWQLCQSPYQVHLPLFDTLQEDQVVQSR